MPVPLCADVNHPPGFVDFGNNQFERFKRLRIRGRITRNIGTDRLIEIKPTTSHIRMKARESMLDEECSNIIINCCGILKIPLRSIGHHELWNKNTNSPLFRNLLYPLASYKRDKSTNIGVRIRINRDCSRMAIKISIATRCRYCPRP